MFKGIDLFSDTATRPCRGMREALAAAEVGDEQLGEDPTTQQLEQRLAELLGFSAVMYFPTATVANQIALRLHCKPGDEILCSRATHIRAAEAGGPAVHAQAMVRTFDAPFDVFDAETVERNVQCIANPYFPRTRLLAIENTTNFGGGVAWPVAQLDGVIECAKALGLLLHLDGSRLFNAAQAVNVPIARLARGFDTVTLCFSKGLGAPLGAALAFPKDRYAEVRRLKQQMGAAMRQSGILAAAALYALDHNVDRLSEDHTNAARFAEGLRDFARWIEVEARPPLSTNMVYFSPRSELGSPDSFLERCVARGLRFSKLGPSRFRAVFHKDVAADDVERALAILKSVMEAMKQ